MKFLRAKNLFTYQRAGERSMVKSLFFVLLFTAVLQLVIVATRWGSRSRTQLLSKSSIECTQQRSGSLQGLPALVQLCTAVAQGWQFDPIAKQKCNLCVERAAVTLLNRREGFTELGGRIC